LDIPRCLESRKREKECIRYQVESKGEERSLVIFLADVATVCGGVGREGFPLDVTV
jgi:hypothetical protein